MGLSSEFSHLDSPMDAAHNMSVRSVARLGSYNHKKKEGNRISTIPRSPLARHMIEASKQP